MSSQPSLLTGLSLPPRQHKHADSVSVAQHQAMVADGTTARMRKLVYQALVDWRMQHGYSPTVSELTRWMFHDGRLSREDTKLVAPRVTELVQMGAVRKLSPRRCDVTGKSARPVQIVSR